MKIWLDFDGVLNNLPYAWVNWVNKNYHANITTKDILHFHWLEEEFGESVCDFWKDPNIYQNGTIQPLNGSKDFVFLLQKKYGINNVGVITHSWIGTEQVKDEFIQDYFKISNIIHEKDKFRKSGDGILIDDNPKNTAQHCFYNRQFGFIYNRDKEYSWATANSILTELKSITPLIRFKYSYEEILKFLEC